MTISLEVTSSNESQGFAPYAEPEAGDSRRHGAVLTALRGTSDARLSGGLLALLAYGLQVRCSLPVAVCPCVAVSAPFSLTRRALQWPPCCSSERIMSPTWRVCLQRPCLTRE